MRLDQIIFSAISLPHLLLPVDSFSAEKEKCPKTERQAGVEVFVAEGGGGLFRSWF